MEERGHRRTWLQCQRKVKSFKSKFKEASDSNNRGRITCPFYNEISRVMGDKPSCQPLELLDSYEAGEEESETPRSSADSLDIDVETDDTSTESLPSASSAPSTSGESSSAAGITETTGRSTTATKSSGTTSAKSRKRKTKMEATLEIFAEKISSALNNTDDTELQLKMQAAQLTQSHPKTSHTDHSATYDEKGTL
ncbi:hypothetical protein R3I93_006684 [Phoxinus phoxinus]|uniref:Myb/SANT-like DNA-binding domain-containing protein n=1 Tax=Phoxinus phoxinus TaxID=58324 RepID=A0AAN9DBY4_9TELE